MAKIDPQLSEPLLADESTDIGEPSETLSLSSSSLDLASGCAQEDSNIATQFKEGDVFTDLAEPPLQEGVALWDQNRAAGARAFVAFCASLGAMSSFEQTFTLFQNEVADQLDVSPAAVSTSFGMFLAVYALVGPFFTKVAAHRGERAVIVVAMICNLAATLGLSFALWNLWCYYIYYLILGVGFGAVYASMIVAPIQLFPSEKQSLAAGVAAMLYSLTALVAGVPLKWLINNVGFQKAYLCQGCCGVCVLFLSIFAVPNYPVASRGTPASKCEAESVTNVGDSNAPDRSWSLKVFAMIYFAYFCNSVTWLSIEAEVQPIMETTLPWAPSHVLLMVVPSCSICSAVVKIPWGMLANRYPATHCLALAQGLFAVALVAWACTRDLYVEFAAAVFAYGCAPVCYCLMPLVISRTFGAAQASSLLSIANTADIVAALLTPVAAGAADLIGWRNVLLVFCCIAVACVLTLLLGVPKDMTPEMQKMQELRENSARGRLLGV